MQPEAKDAAYLWDMIDAARAVLEFVASRSFSDYVADRMLRGAVERHPEVIQNRSALGSLPHRSTRRSLKSRLNSAERRHRSQVSTPNNP